MGSLHSLRPLRTGSRAVASASAQAGPQTLCLWEFAFTPVFCFLFFFFFFTRSQHLYLSLFVLIFSYFRLCWVLVAVYELSLVAVSRGYSQVAVYGLLIAVASLVAEHGS